MPAEPPASGTLKDYVEKAERLLNENNKWHDPAREWAFADATRALSKCLRDYARRTHDPELFATTVGIFLRMFARAVNEGDDKGAVPQGTSTEECQNVPFSKRYHEHEISLQVTPYPSMIAANYLAALGSVDTGVFVLEEWIRKFRNWTAEAKISLEPELQPQLAWYLQRAKSSAIDLPYAFGGFVPSHKQMVRWQLDASDDFAALLRAGNARGWKRLCDELSRPRRARFGRLAPTIHNNVGRSLALAYATSRFYLFENLLPADFANDGDLGLKPPSEYLQEAEAIRDNNYCIANAPGFKEFSRQYTSYFILYTEQLRLTLVTSERNKDQRKSLIAEMRRRLEMANGLGPSSRTEQASAKPGARAAAGGEVTAGLTLLGTNDRWDRHQTRLRLLRQALEAEAERD